MLRQLNLRVNDDFAKRLERLSRLTGRTMSSLLETLGTPVLDEAEADIHFEDEALAAWEEYQLTGVHVTAKEIDALFEDAHRSALLSAEKRG